MDNFWAAAVTGSAGLYFLGHLRRSFPANLPFIFARPHSISVGWWAAYLQVQFDQKSFVFIEAYPFWKSFNVEFL